jgi:rSAM/selenodomain-associated transferase 1
MVSPRTRVTLPGPTLILFAKSPRAGGVKTRLQPPCTPEQAADLAEILVEETVRAAVASWPGGIELCAWPDTNDPLFNRLELSYGVDLTTQAAGDLGSKMLKAMVHAGFPCAVMGCDIPHCTPEMYIGAFRALEGGKSVIGPASDGGYYLIGLQESRPELFDGIHWGGEDVLADTLQRAALTGPRLELLGAHNDIDTFQDLLQIAPAIPRLARWLEFQGF